MLITLGTTCDNQSRIRYTRSDLRHDNREFQIATDDPRSNSVSDGDASSIQTYKLDEQIGFLLRLASQRHTGIFSDLMFADLTPTRFSAMAKLYQKGSLSQNELGRQTAMDVATIKGVVDRLRDRGFVETTPDPDDARRQRINLTNSGIKLIKKAIPIATDITENTLKPLTEKEVQTLKRLLTKIA
jgi:DNA-binding MarR family transcriptional regulator